MNIHSKSAFFLLLVFTVMVGCAAQEKPVAEPPAFPESIADAKWGMQANEVKQAVQPFQDDAGRSPYAMYASRKHFELPAIISYFFTPTSKKLYRTDITYNDPRVYEDVRGKLAQMFNGPTFAEPNRNIWLWKDNSVVLVQKNPDYVQVSFSKGPLLQLNNEEGGEPVKAVPKESRWKSIFRW